MIITAPIIAELAPDCTDPDLHAPGLNAAAEDYEINTVLRVAMWLATLAHESAQFNRLEENLSYSAERLMKVWPGRFKTIEIAKQYERAPGKLANFVYGGRMGNDAEGDGWKYRGRGYLQITGKDNFTRTGMAIGIDLLNFPMKASEPEIAAKIAGQWWQAHGCNEMADADDLENVVRRVNGGLTGWADRRTLYKRALLALKGE